jgi:patatin-like phospholipase/acyl hydrolase
LNERIERIFEDTRLTNALTEVVIVSYSVSKQESRLYSKHMAKLNPAVYDLGLYDVAIATSSAPAFWEVVPTILPDGSEEINIDGGVVQNNPSMYAVTLDYAARDYKRFSGDELTP